LFPVSEDRVSRSIKLRFYQFIYEVAISTLLGVMYHFLCQQKERGTQS
jgi:hypothetical protein